MKCQKMKKYLYRGLSVFMGLYLSLCSCIGSYALDSTSSGATDTWTMNAGTFLELAFQGFAKEISSPFVVWDALSGLNYDGFNVWLQNNDNGEHYHLLTDGTVVGHGGAGYSRDVDKINNSTEIEVQPELTQYVLNYVQYCTTQTDLGYKECYISSYTRLNTSQFNNYNAYKSVQEIIKSNNGFTYMVSPNQLGTGTQNNTYIMTIDREVYETNFIGTVTQGIFTNVGLEHNWSQLGKFPQNTNGIDFRMLRNSNGYIGASSKTYAGAASNAGYSSTYEVSVGNIINNTALWTQGRTSIFTNKDKDELVYVFPTLNAYKNYNAGNPQPYYLTTSGMNSGTWTASGGGVINTGSMNNSGNYYSSVTSGVGSNWTPDQILALVDKVTKANNGSGGSGGSGNNDNDSSIWEKLGETLGNLVDGIINVFVNLIQHLSDGLLTVLHLLFGYTDDNGVEHSGLFDSLLALISTNLTGFLGTVFDFLPSEIVTCFTTVVVLSVLFAIFRFMRR